MVYRRSLFSFPVCFLPLLWAAIGRAEAKCYNVDGTLAGDAYKVCNGTAKNSMCCRGAGSSGGDVCGTGTSYGLCGVGELLSRASCSDPTWKDPSCLKLCIDGTGAHNISMITTCKNGSYCCGKDNLDCCNQGSGVWIVKNQVVSTLATVTASEVPLSTSTSSTVSNAPYPPPGWKPTSASASPTFSNPASYTAGSAVGPQSSEGAASSGGLSQGAKVGLGVAIPILLIALLGIAFFFVRRRRQQKNVAYKDDKAGGSDRDTATILTGGPSRRGSGRRGHARSNTMLTTHTTHTTYSIGTATAVAVSTKSNFGGKSTLGGQSNYEHEIPTIPAYFGGHHHENSIEMTFDDDFQNSAPPYEGNKETNDSIHMQTFAIEIDDGVHENRVFPINPHLVEMDAHEVRADISGVHEIDHRAPDDDERELYLGVIELFKEQPRPSGPEEKIFVDPQERLWYEQEEKISHSGMDLGRESEGLEMRHDEEKESVPWSDEKEIPPSDGMEFSPTSPSHSPRHFPSRLASTSASVSASEIASPIEPERSRPRQRAVNPRGVSISSIPKSHFSPSASPSRIPHSPLESVISMSASYAEIQRSGTGRTGRSAFTVSSASPNPNSNSNSGFNPSFNPSAAADPDFDTRSTTSRRTARTAPPGVIPGYDRDTEDSRSITSRRSLSRNRVQQGHVSAMMTDKRLPPTPKPRRKERSGSLGSVKAQAEMSVGGGGLGGIKAEDLEALRALGGVEGGKVVEVGVGAGSLGPRSPKSPVEMPID